MADPRRIHSVESRLAHDLSWDAAPRSGDDERLRRLVVGAAAGSVGLGAAWLMLRSHLSMKLLGVTVVTATVTATTASLMTASAPIRPVHVAAIELGAGEEPPTATRRDRVAAVPTELPTPAAVPGPTSTHEPVGRSLESAPRPSARPHVTPSAAALLEAANAARARGDETAALGSYAALLEHHPDSREAEVGCVAHGRMLRARRDVVGAEKIFARCVAAHPDGALLETALVGRADALEALGRGAEARRVWAELLRRFPDSLHAERARR
jgi:hypothetical protein